MAVASCFEKDGTPAGTFELPASLFEAPVNEHAVHEAVVAYLANQRQGTASTKERSDVRGGGRKPYRQKGTGRARAGTIRSPLFRGGGTVFGPRPRSYRKDLPRKVRRLALRSSLTSRAGEGAVLVIKALEFEAPRTKAFAGIMKNMGALDGKTLVVLDRPDANTVKSARNIPGVRVTQANMVTTYDVVWADRVVLTADAVRRMEEVFAS